MHEDPERQGYSLDGCLHLRGPHLIKRIFLNPHKDRRLGIWTRDMQRTIFREILHPTLLVACDREYSDFVANPFTPAIRMKNMSKGDCLCDSRSHAHIRNKYPLAHEAPLRT